VKKIKRLMLICGVDDAGRGSLLGPLVIAGVAIQRSKIKKLSKMGIKDSKKLTPKVREQLYKKILNFVDDYSVSIINPITIDRSVQKNNLNHLEAKHMAKVISKLNPKISYVDSCDVNPKRFGLEISDLSKTKIKSYHHADSRFVIVSAASIIAKVSRDRAIKRLQRKYDLGSGYPSDSKTIKFVTNFLSNKKKKSNFIRYSWKPVKRILGEI